MKIGTCSNEFKKDLETTLNILFHKVKNPLNEFIKLLHVWNNQNGKNRKDTSQKSMRKWLSKTLSKWFL